jgi:hypothetical protein
LRSEALQKSVNKKLLIVSLSFGEGWGEVCSREFFLVLFEFTLSDVEGAKKRKNKFNNAKVFNVLL